jgi:hypothetical protein
VGGQKLSLTKPTDCENAQSIKMKYMLEVWISNWLLRPSWINTFMCNPKTYLQPTWDGFE